MDKPHDLASVDGTLWVTDQSIECQPAVTQSNLATVLARSDRIDEALERQVLIDRAMSSMEFASEIVQNANLAYAASVDANKSLAVTEEIANVESPDIVALTASRSEPKLRLRTGRF